MLYIMLLLVLGLFLKISWWVLLSFMFAVLFIPSFHVLIGCFHASFSLVAIPTV